MTPGADLDAELAQARDAFWAEVARKNAGRALDDVAAFREDNLMEWADIHFRHLRQGEGLFWEDVVPDFTQLRLLRDFRVELRARGLVRS